MKNCRQWRDYAKKEEFAKKYKTIWQKQKIAKTKLISLKM
jgi:hypothetical protein